MTAPFTAADMCDEHLAEYLACLDYRLPPAPIRLVAIGGGVEQARQAREARTQQWRDTIISQQGLVLDACRRHSVATP